VAKTKTGKAKRGTAAAGGRAKLLREIFSALREEGASEVRLIAVNKIVVDERVRLKCQIPLCDTYGRNLMCPPHLPSVEDFRRALRRYSRAILIQVSAVIPVQSGGKLSDDVFGPAKKLHELVNRGEKMAFEGGLHFATGLIGGCCRLCDECVAVLGETKCRFPFKARPSMEAMGIDVFSTLRRAGLPVSGLPVGDRVTWTGVILL
jgi:predicted metal-binding protein